MGDNVSPIHNTNRKIFAQHAQNAKRVRAKKEKKKASIVICDYCGYSCPKKSLLQRHVDGVHLKLKSFKCNYCDSSFSEKGHLKIHVDGVHQKLKPFKCND